MNIKKVIISFAALIAVLVPFVIHPSDLVNPSRKFVPYTDKQKNDLTNDASDTRCNTDRNYQLTTCLYARLSLQAGGEYIEQPKSESEIQGALIALIAGSFIFSWLLMSVVADLAPRYWRWLKT